MTRMMFKAAMFASGAALLAACQTTPAYPVKTGYAAPAPIKPQYPITTPAPAPQPTQAQPQPRPVPPPATPPVSSAVESQALPPAAVTPPPGQTLGYTPPSPPPYVPSAPPSAAPASPPPPAYETAAPRRREIPGRTIAGGRVVAAVGMYRDYEVQRHDHLDAIARDLHTTREELVRANHLRSPYNINPGQHLRVPVAKAYVAQSGDTMVTVAKRFGVGVGDLAELNDLPVGGRLRDGVMIALPSNYEDRGPTRLPPTFVTEAAPRPHVQYRPEARSSQPSFAAAPQPGPYTPSAEALAAAAAAAAARRNAPPPPAYTAPRPYNPPPAYAGPSAAPASPAVIASGAGRFVWPVRGDIIAGFGIQGVGRRNDGVDIRSAQGTVVRAAAAGEVVYAGNQVPGFGNLVLIKHADGWVSAYAHLDRISVMMRQTVMQGQELGAVGATGGVAEPQLHFEIRYAATPAEKARPIDPTLVLPK